ncbi:hypothetical protein SAMN02800687_3560 [Curtobacterium sp. UNCCL20]|nr:hypothetical protein SAMN02800687_3560 [Curtobacterium sp. UNCCL20]
MTAAPFPARSGTVGRLFGAVVRRWWGRILDTPDAPSRMSRAGGIGVATVDLGTTLNPSLKLRERARSSWKAVQ